MNIIFKNELVLYLILIILFYTFQYNNIEILKSPSVYSKNQLFIFLYLIKN